MSPGNALVWNMVQMGNASDLIRSQYEEFLALWRNICAVCGGPRLYSEPIDLHLDHAPDDRGLGGVPLIADIMRYDFIDVIGRDIVFEHCYIGKVYDNKGRLWPNFVSVRGKHVINIRGDSTSKYRVCRLCGRHLYSPRGKWHILGSRLTGAPIYGSDPGGFIITEEIYRRLWTKKWKKVGFLKLPVLDKPLDGLDDLPL